MKKAVIGIDIGGTNTVFGLVDNKGKILAENTIPTKSSNTLDKYLQNLYCEIDNLIEAQKEETHITGIGIGAPNGNYYKGTIEFAPNLNWNGVIKLADLFEENYKVPTVLTNDANAAAIGEMKYGKAVGINDFIIITLGTGLGSGFVVNGKVVYGHDGFAGELGHTIVIPGGRKCGCGRDGCLEAYVSAPGIVRTMHELLAKFSESCKLRKIKNKDLSAKMISQAASENDRLAKEAFYYTGKILGASLANAVAITSPKSIFLFGGLANSGSLLLAPTKKYLEKNLLAIYKDKVELVTSGLMDKNAAILGSAALIWHELENDLTL